MKWFKSFFLLSCTLVFLIGCNQGGQQQQQAKPDYDEQKEMVLDILQTEEGKKILAETLTDPKIKQKVILSDMKIQQTIEDTLTSPENKKQLQEVMKDPKFAASFAKAIKEENKDLQKDLMKDPEYQEMMITILKNPEAEELFLEMMKGKAYRQQTMVIMKESLESPMFRVELMEIMTKVYEEETKPKKEKEGGKGKEGGKEKK
jgi:spore germination protein D